MDQLNIETINTITASSGFLGLMACVVSFVFYKLYTNERADRREAWSEINKQTDKHNDILIKNVVTMEGIIKVIKDLEHVIHNTHQK